MGTFETPVAMQTGAWHKYFSSHARVESESDKSSRLMPMVDILSAAIGAKIKLAPINRK